MRTLEAQGLNTTYTLIKRHGFGQIKSGGGGCEWRQTLFPRGDPISSADIYLKKNTSLLAVQVVSECLQPPLPPQSSPRATQSWYLAQSATEGQGGMTPTFTRCAAADVSLLETKSNQRCVGAPLLGLTLGKCLERTDKSPKFSLKFVSQKKIECKVWINVRCRMQEGKEEINVNSSLIKS